MSKFFLECSIWEERLKPGKIDRTKFEDWKRRHTCDKTFVGPSSEMERFGLKELFKRSSGYGLVYKNLIGDGDTKAYLDVWDHYELCDLCKKNSERIRTNDEDWRESEERKKWLELHDTPTYDCNIVIKVDCIGHVSKNFASKLEKKVVDGKSTNRGIHRLGKQARVKLVKNFRNAVQRSTNRTISCTSEALQAVALMSRNIWASLYHSCLIDDPEERHQFCPTDSWCLYKTDNPAAFEDQPHHLHAVFLEFLRPIYEHYTQDSILLRMVPGHNTNINESFNSVLWTFVPKSKFHGKKRQEYATMLAFLVYQKGYTSLDSICTRLSLPIKDKAVLIQQDNARIYRKEKADVRQEKKYQSMLAAALENKRQKVGYATGILEVVCKTIFWTKMDKSIK